MTRCRRGVVLIIVLVVVVVLSLAAYTFSDLMLTHNEASQLNGRSLQAREVVASGAEWVRTFLMLDDETIIEAGGIYNNPQQFQAIPVVQDIEEDFRANFTLVAPALDDEGNLAGVRYGLQDESTRLNVNALLALEDQQTGAGRQLLLALPGMTEDVADAILDWLDEDDDPRDYGAEAEYYSTMQPPYGPKNGPLDTVEELLLVRGVTPRLLFGMDVNRNGMIDNYELQSTELAEDATTTTEFTEFGWASLLTLHGAEWNANSLGEPRIDLNDEDLKQLYADLTAVFDDEWAKFIVAYRQGGAYTGSDPVDSSAGRELNFDLPAQSNITQVLELIGAKTQVTFAGASSPTVLASPFDTGIVAMNVYLPILLNQVSVNPAPTIPGRININQAPRVMLEGIPGMTTELLDTILKSRPVEPVVENLNFGYETWLLTEGLVTLEQMRALSPFVCAGGDVYRAQIVGYYEGGMASSRAEIIFAATGTAPRVLSWRDVSHLGRGYAIETLGVQMVGEEM